MIRVERVLQPKIQLLKYLGVERENIPNIVTRCPRILGYKLENLRSKLEVLKTVFPTNDFLVKTIMRSPYITGLDLQKVLKPSVSFWEGFGFHGIEFIKFLLIDPWILMHSSLTPEKLDLIRKINIDKERIMYKCIVRIVARRRIEVLEAKIDNLHLCGLSPEEAWELIRVVPLVLNKLKERVKKNRDLCSMAWEYL
ncbi:hypothetical protein SUGI_0651440 [Cryptomeria japonica]|nr:hypothetical protein SUGI_0651440 [Cryptomeria japonica]